MVDKISKIQIFFNKEQGDIDRKLSIFCIVRFYMKSFCEINMRDKIAISLAYFFY